MSAPTASDARWRLLSAGHVFITDGYATECLICEQCGLRTTLCTFPRTGACPGGKS